MKVDKAVCTDTYEDLSRAIRFEAVFSTLVENKILAIKRECELKKRNKKSRVIRRILFGRKSCKKVGKWGSESGKKKNGTVKDAEPEGEEGGGEGGTVGAVGGLPLENSTTSDGVDEVIVEIGDLSSLVDADGNVVAVDTGDDYPSKSESDVDGDRRASRQAHSVTAVNLELGNDEDSGGEAFGETDDLPSKSEAIAQSLEYDRKSIKSNDIRIQERCNTLEPVSVSIEKEPHSDPLSTQYDIEDSATNVSIELDVSEISDMKRSIASEPVPIIKNISKYRPGTSRQPSLLGTASHRLRVLEAKSISAQNSPILPRQKSTEARHLTFSTATYQTTSPNPVATKSKKDIEDTSFVIDLSRETADEDNISATSNLSNCNSIVIPKDKQPTLGDGKRSSSHKKSPLAVVADSSSSTSASRKNKLIPTTMTTTAKLLYSTDPSPPPTPGLIESFNQLTSPNLPPVISVRQSASPVSDMIKLHRLSAAGGGSRSTAAQAQTQQPQQHSQEFSNPSTKMMTTIITSNELGGRKQRHGFLRQSSCDVELHYQQQSRQSEEARHPLRHHSRRDAFGAHRAMSSAAAVQHSNGGMIGFDEYGDDPLMATGELNESDEEKLNKRKYKYLKRCSDPVIVFPSTSTGGVGTTGGGSGLQHCILSRPPNQPM
ncbi:AAEL001630-PA [Aedes aegypti]|uniref:AAEL001630-PA n=1 Tax=Aedes aegypti TaxID=7159 RepID=Q17KQ4_AEDAE|nr:AAEL001630-PA [Aedes aegypti]